jgi:ATP-dependent protease HslVU (ClpYQ) peptidase subunit
MTTIVYDHKNKQIACDSRMAKSSGVYSDCYIKMTHKKDRLFIMAGSTCDIDYFIENFEKYNKVDIDVIIDCSGIMIQNGKAYSVFIYDSVFNLDLLICNQFEGSGGKFALSALDFGKTAKEAVEYAITKDCYSGGKVHVYDIEKADFI